MSYLSSLSFLLLALRSLFLLPLLSPFLYSSSWSSFWMKNQNSCSTKHFANLSKGGVLRAMDVGSRKKLKRQNNNQIPPVFPRKLPRRGARSDSLDMARANKYRHRNIRLYWLFMTVMTGSGSFREKKSGIEMSKVNVVLEREARMHVRVVFLSFYDGAQSHRQKVSRRRRQI